MAATKKKKTAKPKREYYSEAEIKKGIFSALYYEHPTKKTPGYAAAARVLKIDRGRICHWVEEHPEWVEEIRPEVEQRRQADREQLAEILRENAFMFALEHNTRLKECPETYKPYDLTGGMDYSIKNMRLLQGESTGNIEKRTSIEEWIIIMAEIDKGKNDPEINNRLKDLG